MIHYRHFPPEDFVRHYSGQLLSTWILVTHANIGWMDLFSAKLSLIIRPRKKILKRYHIERGKKIKRRQKKRWGDNIRDWAGLEFANSQRAEDRRWWELLAQLSVVPQLSVQVMGKWNEAKCLQRCARRVQNPSRFGREGELRLYLMLLCHHQKDSVFWLVATLPFLHCP